MGQHRDVYVANFYARDTIDQDVYRILHDKLRMFELLFGQITTILGEIDTDTGDTSTFDGEILRALLAPDDQEMKRCCGSLKVPTVDHRSSPVVPWGSVGLG